jgi:hypothetical protein
MSHQQTATGTEAKTERDRSHQPEQADFNVTCALSVNSCPFGERKDSV